ncbi:MAG TPA: triphosphoribosyl-dephospho-CoA synthase [Lacipirellula sp.]
MTIGASATLACLWEATAPKPGNVYRGADFEDLTYADFVTCAAMIGPVVDRAPKYGVGGTVLAGVRITRSAVSTNSNLGILLLLAPLALVSSDRFESDVDSVLERLTIDDTRKAYAAIREANPGGLGEVNEGDVNAAETPQLNLREVMELAADRDLIAQQYVNGFKEVLWTADRIQAALLHRPMSQAIVYAYLELLVAHPDSLIQRKCGAAIAEEASRRAAVVLESHASGQDVYEAALADFDFWLRADGHRRNPGTSADIIAAALFVLLREGRIQWPVKFY